MEDPFRAHLETVTGAAGPKVRIVGHRIRVMDVVIWHEKLGLSPDEIVHDHPTISLSDIHAALSYYWDHREEIERAIAEEQTLVEQLRLKMPSLLVEKSKRRRRA